MSNISNLSSDQLKRAVKIKEQIERLQRELSAMVGSTGAPQRSSTGSGMSAATKAKLRAAAKARWAKINAGKQSPAPAKPAKKSTMSAAARAKISAAAKARWVKARAAGKKRL